MQSIQLRAWQAGLVFFFSPMSVLCSFKAMRKKKKKKDDSISSMKNKNLTLQQLGWPINKALLGNNEYNSW